MEGTNAGKELNSEATVVKLLGMVLEKIERETLWKMGSHIGGLPIIEIVKEPGEWMMEVRVSMIFDMLKVNEYFSGLEGSI